MPDHAKQPAPASAPAEMRACGAAVAQGKDSPDAHRQLFEATRGRIITDYWMKPIPMRCFDWSAVREDYDGAEDSNCPMGHGLTEQAAIDDLLEIEEMHAETREAARLEKMMADAVQECIDQGRADPRNPLVCVLPAAQLSREARDVPQRWRDRAIEHLAVRPDARV